MRPPLCFQDHASRPSTSLRTAIATPSPVPSIPSGGPPAEWAPEIPALSWPHNLDSVGLNVHEPPPHWRHHVWTDFDGPWDPPPSLSHTASRLCCRLRVGKQPVFLWGLPDGGVVGFKAVPTPGVQVPMSILSLQPVPWGSSGGLQFLRPILAVLTAKVLGRIFGALYTGNRFGRAACPRDMAPIIRRTWQLIWSDTGLCYHLRTTTPHHTTPHHTTPHHTTPHRTPPHHTTPHHTTPHHTTPHHTTPHHTTPCEHKCAF